MSTPLLSIGIIFKNEIRCLERCLKSLQPLRDALPCEVVMADTGATDGSRAVAERYADILFDFPWVNDFSAARNAVMERCSGKWYMTIDCDEWVGADIQGFVTFLTAQHEFDFGGVIIRNYNTLELEAGTEYNITINGTQAGVMKANLGGKLSLSVEMDGTDSVSVGISRK